MPERFVGPAPDPHRLTDRFFLELLEIARKAPGQIAILAYHAVFCDGHNECDFGGQTHFLRNLSRFTTSALADLPVAGFADFSAGTSVGADAVFFFPREDGTEVAGRSSGSEAATRGGR